jgi:hypothetical protein
MKTTTTTKIDADGRVVPPTSVVGPMAVSVVVHALLLVVLLTVALNVTPGVRVRAADDAFAISIDEPMVEPEPMRADLSPTVPTLSVAQTQGELSSTADLVKPGATPTLAGIGRAGRGGGVASLVRGGGSGHAGVSFAGLRTKRAARVVYVVDGSGSMVTSLPFVVEELLRSIDRLDETQHFAVVLFRNQPPAEGGQGSKHDVFASAEGSMLLASERNKRRLRQWVAGLVPRGISNPSDGLARALSFKPDAVFLLARSIRRSGPNAGWGVGLGEIMTELERENPLDAATQRRPAVIKTIQFIDEDPTGTMQRIGDEHGTSAGESGYTLLTLPALEALEHEAPVEDTLDTRIDRAADILSALSASGRDTAALFGIGVEAERADAAKEAGKALRAVRQSESSSDLARLVRARSRMLIAAGGNGRELGEAIDELASASADGPAVLHLNHAIALVMRSGEDDRARAAAILATIDADELDPTSEAEFLMVRVLADVPGSRGALLGQMADEPFRTAAGVDGSLSAAASDVLAREAFRETDPRVVGDALEPWAELIRDGSLGREALLARAGAAAASVQGGGMPDEVAYAVARAALQGDLFRSDTIELLDRVAGRASGWLGLDALRDGGLARVAIWEQNADPSVAIEAAERLLRYVERSPGAGDRGEMLTLSLGLCERVMGDASNAAIVRHAEIVYAQGTAMAVDVLPREQGRSDHWVCAYARGLLAGDVNEDGDAAQRAANRARALTLLEAIGPESPAADDAARLRLFARLRTIEDLQREMASARARFDEAGVAAAARAILAQCDRAQRDAVAVGGQSADAILADRADALVELALSESKTTSAVEARAIYDDLVARTAAVAGGSARLGLGRARAMLSMGETARAFAVLREVARGLDHPGNGATRPERFWHAWTLLVEISADNARPVRAHIAGLVEIDPTLGGEPWRTRLNAAAAR